MAKTDTYGLYYSGMATDYPTVAINPGDSTLVKLSCVDDGRTKKRSR